jgi:hypothetical protein
MRDTKSRELDAWCATFTGWTEVNHDLGYWSGIPPQPPRESEERVPASTDPDAPCKLCNGKGFVEVHMSGFTHYETDAGEGCPAYHYNRVPCSCKIVAPAQCDECKHDRHSGVCAVGTYDEGNKIGECGCGAHPELDESVHEPGKKSVHFGKPVRTQIPAFSEDDNYARRVRDRIAELGLASDFVALLVPQPDREPYSETNSVWAVVQATAEQQCRAARLAVEGSK